MTIEVYTEVWSQEALGAFFKDYTRKPTTAEVNSILRVSTFSTYNLDLFNTLVGNRGNSKTSCNSHSRVQPTGCEASNREKENHFVCIVCSHMCSKTLISGLETPKNSWTIIASTMEPKIGRRDRHLSWQCSRELDMLFG
jgi:hypothetical protein